MRAALGASAPRTVGLVVAHAARVTGVGLLIGVAAALLLAPRLRDMRQGAGPRDPLTYAAAAVALVLTSAVAAGVSAWRAARVVP